MLFKDMTDRVNNGEVAIVDSINGLHPEVFISKNWNHFQNLTIENDVEQAGCFWIYNKEIRSQREYNP